MRTQPEEPSLGRRAGRAFTRLLVTLLVVALIGVVGYLLSILNARTFTLEEQAGKLVVLKGRMFPVGSDPFRPADPFLADAYAPIPLEGQPVGTLILEKFRDRDELDRALFGLLEMLARPRVASDEPQALEKGLYFLRRAEKLHGLTEEQRRSLKAMQAEVAFYQARSKLDDARKLVAEGLSQLRVASESQTRNARNAHQMLVEVEPSAKALEQALRRAVHTLSAPATPMEPAPTEPKAAPPDATSPQRPDAAGGTPTVPQGQTPAGPPAQGTPSTPSEKVAPPAGTRPATPPTP
jgi:hypothetical protein